MKKKIFALLYAYLIVYFITSSVLFPYADISVKVSYINGSAPLSPGQKGILSVKDNLIVFYWGKDEIEIPYSSIDQMSWSEKKRLLKFNTLPKSFDLYQPQMYIPPPPTYEPSVIDFILWGLSALFLILGIIKMTGPKKVYFRIDYESGGSHEWILFKTTEDRFNILYSKLAEKSGKEIVLFEKN
jgi:hypothetical protein